MIRLIQVPENEIALWFRHGDLRRVLEPGRHLVVATSSRDVVRYNTLNLEFAHAKLRVLVRDPQLRKLLHVLDLSSGERAFVWQGGRLQAIAGPGLHAFWKQTARGDNHAHAPGDELVIETVSVEEAYFEHEQLDAILLHPDARAEFSAVDVSAHEQLLVHDAGRFLGAFGPGRHAFWNAGNRIEWQAVDLRERIADVSGQEILTADRVTLRLHLVVAWQVTDAVQSVTVVKDAEQALYREAQLALRSAVGGRTLDTLLADKDAVGTEVLEALALRVKGFGVAIRGVGIRDIVLPGEMRQILNQVIEAEKQAEANFIRRREETAAARSQANTARLLAENPVLARMKELEALQDILRGTRASFVFGLGAGGNDLRDQIRSLVAPEPDGG